MAKKETAIATPEQKPVSENLGWSPDAVSDPSEYMQGYDVQTCVQLTEPGQGITGKFCGFDGTREIPQADGEGVSEVNLWRFEVGNMSIRLFGATGMDKELRGIENSYDLPVGVRVLRMDTRKTNKGRQFTEYFVGVSREDHGKRKAKTSTSDPFPS